MAHVLRKVVQPPDARARAIVPYPHEQLVSGVLVRSELLLPLLRAAGRKDHTLPPRRTRRDPRAAARRRVVSTSRRSSTSQRLVQKAL